MTILRNFVRLELWKWKKNIIIFKGHSFYADPGIFLWDQSAVNTAINISVVLIMVYIIVQLFFLVGDQVRDLLGKHVTKTEKGRSLSTAQELTSLTNRVMDAIIKFGNKNNGQNTEEKDTWKIVGLAEHPTKTLNLEVKNKWPFSLSY